VSFLERRDRLVELAELLVREAEVRQQHRQGPFGLRVAPELVTAGASTSATS
jgi:hypothetical protein